MSGSRLRDHLLAIPVGACAVLAFSPFDLWPVFLLVCIAVFLLMRGLSPGQAAWRGWCLGVGFYGAGVSWVYVSIHNFGGAPVSLAFVLTTLLVMALALMFTAPQFALYRWLCQCVHSEGGWPPVLLFGAVWVLFEWVRGWFLTGFPWFYAGYALIDTPLASWAPVIGVPGLSLLLILLAGGLAQYLYYRHDRTLLAILTGIVILALLSIPLRTIQWTRPVDGQTLSFAVVQADVALDLKWSPKHLDDMIATYLRLSRPFWNRDIIIWPENAIPALYQNINALVDQLDASGKATRTSLVFGVPWYENGRFYNSIVSLGAGSGHYFKQKLVPFGEYVPFESVLRGLIALFDLPASSFSSGSDNQAPLQVAGHPVAALICYEAVYPDFVAAMVRDTGFLITISDDSWFGASIGPFQHFQMARMRALETGRYMIRSTNGGVNALIDEKGRVISQFAQRQAGVLDGELPVMTGNTPFMRFASGPVLALCLLLLLASLQPWRFRHRASDPLWRKQG